MTYHVEVGPGVKQSTHHIALTDGKQWLGLIVCDSKGAADPYNISAAPNQRSSLRTKSGTTKYEDLEDPWSATAQDDWSGGRGLEDYESDTTRFFDSRRCQTAFGQIYNAPLDYYASGIKESITNWPGSVMWKALSANTAYAVHLNLTAAMNVGEVYILLRRRGNPAAPLRVALCRDDNGIPGAEIKYHSYTIDEITDVVSEWKRFSFSNIRLNAGNYWILVYSMAGDISDNWQVGFKDKSKTYQTFVTENGKWQPTRTYDLYYRIAAADTGRKARFFTYKQLTFALTQLPSGEPKLFMNGEIGMADSNSGNLDKVIDGTKHWAVNQWQGCRVGIIAGQGIQESVSAWRTIKSNDATTLTVDSPWLNVHDETTTYVIVDTGRFTEIPAATHGLSAYVTDIAVVNDIIYFAQGDAVPIRKLRWLNGTWQSMADEYIHKVMPAEDPEEDPETPTDPDAPVTPDPDPTPSTSDLIARLQALLEQGVITQEQYDAYVALLNNGGSLSTSSTAAESTGQESELVQRLRSLLQLGLITQEQFDAYVAGLDGGGEEAPDKAALLAKLRALLDQGVITQEQYDAYVALINGSDEDEDEDEDEEREAVEVTIRNCATYLQTVRDTSGLVLWRAQNNDENHQMSISQTAVTDWLSEDIVVCELTETEGEELPDEGEPPTMLVVLKKLLEQGKITQEQYEALLDHYGIVDEGDTKPAIDSDNDDVYTDGVDFGKPDDVAVLYKVTVGKITGEDHPVFRVMLQSSEDNIIYEDVKSVDVDTSHSELYFSAATKRRWRRMHITILAGDSPALSAVKVETVNHSKFIGTHTFHDSYGKITGLAEYPMMMNSAYKTLWINREGMIHSISSEGVVDTINLEELSTAMEEWNGVTSMQHNVYYYVRWMKGGIQRYYNQQMDAVGPDRDTGLPEDRQGAIVDMLPYPGRYFAVVDAGKKGYSSVLLNNNSGWHEIYRAPNVGERIHALGYQAISGDRPDKLWISVGDEIIWLVMPSNTLKAYQDDAAEYTHESVLISSWMSIGMVDVMKQWGSMNIFAENLEGEDVYIEADYQLDQDPNWYPMSGYYTETPTQEIGFDDAFGVSAKRLRYRLRLQTNDKKKTPLVKAVVMKTVIKVPTKYNFSMPCRNVMNDVNLRGEVEDMKPLERHRLLTEWADNAVALKMYSFTPIFNDKRVFLDPPSFSNLREMDKPGFIVQVNANEI